MRIPHGLALIAMPLLIAADGPPAGAAAGDVPISFAMRSWGQPVVEWTIAPDGSIRRVESDNKAAARYGAYDRVTSITPPSPPRYRWIADLLKPAQGAAMPCKDLMTDAAYGELRWGDGASARTLKYNAGCMDKPTAAVIARLQKADAQIEVWTKKDGKEIERTHVGAP